METMNLTITEEVISLVGTFTSENKIGTKGKYLPFVYLKSLEYHQKEPYGIGGSTEISYAVLRRFLERYKKMYPDKFITFETLILQKVLVCRVVYKNADEWTEEIYDIIPIYEHEDTEGMKAFCYVNDFIENLIGNPIENEIAWSMLHLLDTDECESVTNGKMNEFLDE